MRLQGEVLAAAAYSGSMELFDRVKDSEVLNSYSVGSEACSCCEFHRAGAVKLAGGRARDPRGAAAWQARGGHLGASTQTSWIQ